VKRALLAITAVCVPAAWAENERALSVGVSWATFSTQGTQMGSGSMQPPAVSPDVGGALSVIYEHAIGSDIALRGEVSGGVFYGGNDNTQSSVSYAAIGDAGAVFRFDVLKYVPYAFGGIGGMVTERGPIDRGAQLVLTIGGGLDVLVSRSRSWGIEGRLASFGGDVTVFTLGVRGTTRWGYF
jgi:hypothetical protein